MARGMCYAPFHKRKRMAPLSGKVETFDKKVISFQNEKKKRVFLSEEKRSCSLVAETETNEEGIKSLKIR